MNRGIEALENLLRKFRYKDGWSFHLVPFRQAAIDFTDRPPFIDTTQAMLPFMTPYTAYRLKVQYRVPDTYHPGKMADQEFAVIVPDMGERIYGDVIPLPDEEAWARWLYHVIVFLEEHEAAEFMLVDGKRPFDPHAKGSQQPMTRIPGLVEPWPRD